MGIEGYRVSKHKLDEFSARSKAQKVARAAQWVQKCVTCGNPIPYAKRRNEFCSHACSARASNPLRFKVRDCPACMGQFVGANKFCPQCIEKNRHVHNANIPFDLLRTDSSRRHRLIKELGSMCQLCGIREWRALPVPVVMDHIDGNADNNSRDNCRLICPNCDAQLPTFSGRNRGKGRSTKRNSVKHYKAAAIV